MMTLPAPAGLESLDKHFKISDIVFTMTTYNPEFTRMEVWFRFFFLLSTCAVLAAFVVSMRSYGLDDWAIEQKWAVLLLVMLAGYDDPLFPLW